MGIIYINGAEKIKFSKGGAIPNQRRWTPKVFGKNCKNLRYLKVFEKNSKNFLILIEHELYYSRVCTDPKRSFTMPKKKDAPIIRQRYLKTLLDYKDKKVIKVITGIRRCGKSTMMSIFADELTKMGVPQRQIIEMNFESMMFNHITGYEEFYAHVAKLITPRRKTYLFFDKIQMVKNWEKAVNSFLADFNVDIYITGSNAYLLSSELSTLLSGRYVEIKMLPLSFKEFLDFNRFSRGLTLEDKFLLFVKYGGMPAVAEYGFNEKMIYEMLEGVYNTVIVKDIAQRNKITYHTLLKKLTDFLAHSIGSVNVVRS
jgi:uncharacterized protein